MAANLRASVQKEIVQLGKHVKRKKEELVFLRAELARLKRVSRVLTDGKVARLGATTGRQSRKKVRKAVDWNAVLKGLPNPFSVQQLDKVPQDRGKSKVYLRQIVSRWAKQGKAKRVAKGQYQKA